MRADVGAQDWLGRALLLDVHISSGAASSREARRRGDSNVSKFGIFSHTDVSTSDLRDLLPSSTLGLDMVAHARTETGIAGWAPRRHHASRTNRFTAVCIIMCILSRRLAVLSCAVLAHPVYGLTLASIATNIRAAIEPPVWSDPVPANGAMSLGSTPTWVVDGSDVNTGVCNFYDAVKGFGFITVDGDTDNLFVHHSDLGCSRVCCDGRGAHPHQHQPIANGQRLSFMIARHSGDGRTKATEVCRIERSDGGVAFDDDEELDALFDEFFPAEVPAADREHDLF